MALPDLPFAPPAKFSGSKNGLGASARRDVKGKGKASATIVLDSGSESDEYQAEAEYEEHGEGGTEDEEALARLDQELLDIGQQIFDLQQLESTLHSDRLVLQARRKKKVARPAPVASVKKPASATDFWRKDFPWSEEIKSQAKEVWGIDKFRMCQEPALNATLQGRDLMVVMPTGGGKSLIYQLPSLLLDGTTVVVTPLISLMVDQCYNLRARGVRAELLNAATSQEDSRTIMKKMISGGSAATAKGKGKGKAVQLSVDEDEREIKLVYVTPEKIEKSKTFVSTLQKMYDADRLSRIIIDEAHCCSTLGHDYRTSYLSLGKLKTLFPNTPITALTATAPQSVIEDTLKILHLPRKTSPGDAALDGTTVLFTAPLYRSNLIYSVVPRPKEADAAIDAITDWILEHRLGETGIIYCLSRADTEKVCLGVNSKSGGKVRCAVYHSGVSDADKLEIHKQWRTKRIHCVIATNAFGLGIDSPDCRFVLHHTVSKSIEGYYQESGRAGRDGVESDCVIFYRSSDSSRLSTLTYESFFTGGREKLYAMLSFAEDLQTCRKLLFARAFSVSHASKSAFEEGASVDDPCGHCDNCLRDPSSFETVDCAEDAYRALRIISAAERQSATLTLMQAADLIRGLQGGSFSTQGKQKGKGSINVQDEAGGKVSLSKEAAETLIVRLLIEGYLREDFHNTAYATLAYIKTSQRSLRFTRVSPAKLAAKESLITFPMTIASKKAAAKPKAKAPAKRKASATDGKAAKKVKTAAIESSDDEPVLGHENGDGPWPDEDEEAALFEAGDFGDLEDEVEGFNSTRVDGDGWQVCSLIKPAATGGTDASSDGFEFID